MRHFDCASILRALPLFVSFAAAAGCGESHVTVDAGTDAPVVARTVGAGGGTISTTSGDVRVEIPAGALDHDVALTIGPPATTPDGVVGTAVEIGPTGTTFRTPIRLIFTVTPADAASSDLGQLAVAVYQNDDWMLLDQQTSDPAARTVSAVTTHLSLYGVVRGCRNSASCVTNSPKPFSVSRSWTFEAVYRDHRETTSGGPVYEGAVASSSFDLGTSVFGGDGKAGVQVFSNETGDTYWVSAEAPGAVDAADMARPIGGSVLLSQLQSFVKRSPTARLQLELNQVILEAIDDRKDPCQSSAGTCRDDLEADVSFLVRADKYRPGKGKDDSASDTAEIFHFACGEDLDGWRGHWDRHGAFDAIPCSLDPSFQPDLDDNGGEHARLKLRMPLTVDIPLGGVDVGDTVALTTLALASAVNYRQGESSLFAFLMDPSTMDGLTVTFEGLEPVVASPRDPADVPPPTACPGPPDPAAGTLQLAGAVPTTREGSAGAWVVVTREGGTRGEVSATIRTTDGTATADADYTAVDTLVRFPDGQGGSRLVQIPIAEDGVVESDESFTVALSDPRGCAALGAATQAVVTIVDDDVLPAMEQMFTLGGTVSGLVGTGLVLGETDGGGQVTPGNGPFTFPAALVDGRSYDVRVLAQPAKPLQSCKVSKGTGRISGANVTSVEVTCTTPVASVGLDPTFADGGRLTAAIPAAAALALQPDGKLVIVGDMTLARYGVDGTPDLSFGVGGKVTVVANGGPVDAMQAVAVQADGKIVTAGSTSTPPSSRQDTVILRYLPDGSLDTGFGTGGKSITPFDSGGAAYDLLLQPDDKMVVVATGSVGPAATAVSKMALVRYLGDGTLDPGFGGGGKVTSDKCLLGYAGALQNDGAIVVAGGAHSSGGSVVGVCLTRFRSDGSIDPAFGSGGTTQMDTVGGVALGPASGVAFQSTGDIIVGARANGGGYALLRLTANGVPDMMFGGEGVARTPLSTDIEVGHRIAVSPDGAIIAVGYVEEGDFGIARFLAGGSVDAGFGNAGVLAVDFSGGFEVAHAAVIQPDGRLVVGGSVAGALGVIRALP